MKAAFQKKSKLFVILWLLALTASSCVLPAPQRSDDGSQRGAPFLPPTLSPTHAPTQAPQETTNSSTNASQQTGSCTDLLAFVSDVTVPDGTIVASGSLIDKRWEVENSGTCSWTARYRLKLLTGPQMGLQPLQTLPQFKAGTKGTIRMMFTAPKEPGTYRSAWQAVNPDGVPFGDPVYIEVLVQSAVPTP